jgi:excisionase family DNA binding protein
MAIAEAPTKLLTVPEVAAELAVHRRTVERLIADGQLRRVRVGRSSRIRRDDLAEFIRRNTEGA